MPIDTKTLSIRHFVTAADYRKRFVIPEQITPYIQSGQHFIDENAIFSTLTKASLEPANDVVRVRAILAKSRAIETLLTEETATLIQVTDPELLQEMAETALATLEALPTSV